MVSNVSIVSAQTTPAPGGAPGAPFVDVDPKLTGAPALQRLDGFFKRAKPTERETLLKLQKKGVKLGSYNGWWAN